MFFLALVILAVVIVLLRNLERSRLGRAWMAVREDELAATCMGVNATRVKLSAFALGAALAGLAGCLYATVLGTTAGPDAFDFSRSVITLSCIILGGLGSIRGTLLGVLLLIGFDHLLASRLDASIANLRATVWPEGDVPAWAIRFISFSNWRLMLFGLVLVLMMRFRPEGLLPSSRLREELHPDRDLAPQLPSLAFPNRQGA